ncbi:hypothetical protein HYDPIDRAFT_33125 [Hydnomerulius pinastri MD-312]|uniref:Uncharacterized protein n=1 Tax=Hydnomerulius pinastri MD-312 TaxID=994086 RepID=A0A0C9W9H0_9AGAM|nr:hypothetical protein HYDPIDRAFT_33125 [Hydnomerulius pinastri MD-312]
MASTWVPRIPHNASDSKYLQTKREMGTVRLRSPPVAPAEDTTSTSVMSTDRTLEAHVEQSSTAQTLHSNLKGAAALVGTNEQSSVNEDADMVPSIKSGTEDATNLRSDTSPQVPFPVLSPVEGYWNGNVGSDTSLPAGHHNDMSQIPPVTQIPLPPAHEVMKPRKPYRVPVAPAPTVAPSRFAGIRKWLRWKSTSVRRGNLDSGDQGPIEIEGCVGQQSTEEAVTICPGQTFSRLAVAPPDSIPEPNPWDNGPREPGNYEYYSVVPGSSISSSPSLPVEEPSLSFCGLFSRCTKPRPPHRPLPDGPVAPAHVFPPPSVPLLPVDATAIENPTIDLPAEPTQSISPSLRSGYSA